MPNVDISITTSSTGASKGRFTRGSASFVTSTENTGKRYKVTKKKPLVLNNSGKLKTFMLS